MTTEHPAHRTFSIFLCARCCVVWRPSLSGWVCVAFPHVCLRCLNNFLSPSLNPLPLSIPLSFACAQAKIASLDDAGFYDPFHAERARQGADKMNNISKLLDLVWSMS